MNTKEKKRIKIVINVRLPNYPLSYKWQTVEAEEVTIEGLEQFHFYIHKSPMNSLTTWSVVEETTGLLIRGGSTQEEAIENAQTVLQTMGVKQVALSIERGMKNLKEQGLLDEIDVSEQSLSTLNIPKPIITGKNLYRVVSEQLDEFIREGPTEGHYEPYRIAELVIARSPAQAKWLAWKTDKSSFTGNVKDRPKMSCRKKATLAEDIQYGVVSNVLEYQFAWEDSPPKERINLCLK
mgnify:FL=1